MEHYPEEQKHVVRLLLDTEIGVDSATEPDKNDLHYEILII